MSDEPDALQDDEFREAVGDVQPIPMRRRRRAALRGAPPQPVARQRQRDERAVLEEAIAGPLSLDDALDSGSEPSYLRPGVSRQLLRKLRRGHWVIEDDLDLHGLNRAQAADQVTAFLHGCRRRHLRCVRIVHGKGLGSRNREPVLKHLLQKLLPRRDDVVAFCQAPAGDGGSGALLLLLARRR